jgi:predicted RNA binding protein YcfA (HicA-like mRNA interferase family)
MSDYQRWIRQVAKVAEKAGWTVLQNGHFKFRSPDGKVVVASFSPKSSERTILNVRRDLKLAGLAVA